MLTGEAYDDIVGRLFASALGEQAWPEMLGRLAGHFHADKAILRVTDRQGTLAGFNVHGYTADYVAQFYAGEMCRRDPRFALFERAKVDLVYFDRSLFDVEEMNRNPDVRASNDVLGVSYSLGMTVSLGASGGSQLALMKNVREGQATADEISSFRRLVPHVAQALALGQIVDQRAATQTALLDAMARKADGIIILGRSGAPTFMNASAQAMLNAGDGLAYCGDQFVTCRGAETRRLRRLIGCAIAAGPPSGAQPGGEMLVTRSSGRRPYMVRVMPAPPAERFLTGISIACVIHLHDLAAVSLPSRALLCAAFGFTEREADLAVQLVICANLSSAAEHAGMAHNTARNHLQGIFRKSGTASQAEAVQLFSRLA